jgi:hypothetical protein
MNNTIEEIHCIEDYYNVSENKITVRMICVHAIYGRLSKEIVMDMLSYLYGVYEDIAVYGNDHETRSKAQRTMNYIDEAVNLIDSNDSKYHLQRLAYEDNTENYTNHSTSNVLNYRNPQGGSPISSGASTPLIDNHLPTTPPHIIRVSRFYRDYDDEDVSPNDFNNEYSAWNV